MLLQAAADDFEDPDTTRRLLRDLREVRMAKLRKGVRVLDAGAGVQMNGVGGMEVAECRNFVVGVVDGLRWVLCDFFFFCSFALLQVIGGDVIRLRMDDWCEMVADFCALGNWALRGNSRGGRERVMMRAATRGAEWMTTTRTCSEHTPRTHTTYIRAGKRPIMRRSNQEYGTSIPHGRHIIKV